MPGRGWRAENAVGGGWTSHVKGAQMATNLVIMTSIACQVAAVVLAIRLMWITGSRWSWGFVSLAIFLMTARRLASLYVALVTDSGASSHLLPEAIGLAISVCMVAGLAGIAPYFVAARQSAASLETSHRRIEHFNAVLRGTRDINQLAMRETDSEALLNGVCEILVGQRAYRHVWIAQFDQAGRPRFLAEAGLGRDRGRLHDLIERGELTPCACKALLTTGVIAWTGDLPQCRDCCLWTQDSDARAMAVKLAHGSDEYGVMVVAVPRPFPVDEEEQALFGEAARDVSLALRNLQAEEERRQMEQGLRLDESRLEALLRLNQMTDAPLKEITDFALEEAVRLTQSEIGYLAFLNEDESILTMHSWSKSAMAECQIIDKPIVYQVAATGLWGEAVRQRRAVITNDYPAPNPWKKGYPGGHVPVLRHMNSPIFEGDRIVVLAGVGNKAQPYDDSDVRQLTLLMQGMWGLLHRKQAADALQQAHDQLESRVTERTAELAKSNAELVRARDAAEAASRAKSMFLANMSHEIRTPLNAVIGMTELVLKSELSAQQREFLTTVRDSGEALLSVINDILDFSKIEAGKLQLDATTFDLRESLGNTLKSFAIRAHQQGLELASLIHPDVPHMVVGDYNRLRQVVVNLIGNALKFTERGEVVLEVCRESNSAQQVALHFTVSDTGIGISLEKQATIFGMFEQADGSTTRRFGGTGLGLAIATRLVQLMGGRIWVESEIGQGSRFHFTISLQLADGEPMLPSSPEPVSLHGLRVLVVDDNATNRRILQEVIDSWQMRPTVVANGDDALQCLRAAHDAGEPFDLVLVDAHMPHVDGLMLAEQIRQDAHARHTVIMMLTSGERTEDQVKCRELDVAAYLLKPIKQSELLDAIQMAMGVAVPKRIVQPEVDGQEARGLQILLAEDSIVNQKLAVALLRDHGHSVTLARNGHEAVAISASTAFDLILMDVQMPEMDGFEATTAIRERERGTGQRIPIVAMTAYALKGDRELCLTAGMDGYVAKPIRAQELFAAIGKLFPASSAPENDGATSSETMSSVERVKWAEALEAVQGDHELLRTVVEAALEEIPQLLIAIRESITSQDSARLHRSAHTLKSSLRYFGAQDAAEKAWHLETNGRDANLVESAATLAALEPLVAQIREELVRFIRDGQVNTM